MFDDNGSSKVIRLRQVQELIGLSRSTIYDRLDSRSPRYDQSFPRPIRLNAHSTSRGRIGFLEGDVYRWIEERIRQSVSAC